MPDAFSELSSLSFFMLLVTTNLRDMFVLHSLGFDHSFTEEGCTYWLLCYRLFCSSSVKKDEADSTIQFQQCIKILADKVSFLSRQSEELVERYSRVEAAHGILVRELEEKKTLINNLYSKLQLEKQVHILAS